MLKTRVFSSLLGLALVAAIIFCGGYVLKGSFILLGLIGLYEFLRMMKARDMNGLLIPSYLLYLCIVCSSELGPYLALAVFAVVMLFMAGLLVNYREERLADLAFSLMGALYLGFGLYFAVEISSWEAYVPAVILVFLLTWSSDIGGYAVGMRWGRHKMAPVLSPGKSWEGAAGCVFFTVAASLVFAWYTGASYWGLWIILGIAASAAAQMGDLLESACKRYFGVKDSGTLIPGHGGVLDRFDSFLFVLPLVYYVYVISSRFPGLF